jgi:hypothetical protein
MTNNAARAPRSRRRRLWFCALLLLLVLAVLELTAFVGFWIVDRQPFGYARLAQEQAALAATAAEATTAAGGGQGNVLNASLHPYLGFVYHPNVNTEAWRRATGREVNRFGFNDAHDPIQRRSEDKLLVGIFGGSVAAWVGFDGGEALAKALAASPRFQGREVVVMTYAIGGYKQPQQLLALNWLLAHGGELDLAIEIDGFNECHLMPTNVLAKVYPLYPALWQQVAGTAEDRERQRRVGEVVFHREQRRAWAAAFTGSWLQGSLTAQFAWRLWDRVLAARLGAASHRLDEYVPEATPFEVRGPGTEGFTLDTIGSTIADVWQRCSLQMQHLCAANGIEFHHCLQPNQYVAGSKPMTAAERALALSPGTLQELAVTAGYPALLARVPALTAGGVHFHDLRDTFAGVDEALYIDAFCHVNARGSQLLAERIAREIGAQ